MNLNVTVSEATPPFAFTHSEPKNFLTRVSLGFGVLKFRYLISLEEFEDKETKAIKMFRRAVRGRLLNRKQT